MNCEGELSDLIAAANAIGVNLIVLDTLSRLLAGGDENSAQDMGMFIRNVSTLRHETLAHIAIVHHGTKASNGSTPRGHSSLTGADDALIEVLKLENSTRTATIIHAKDDVDGDRHAFELIPVELGTDDDGDPITTLIVREMTEAPARRSNEKLSTNEQIALQCLHKALKDRRSQHRSTAWCSGPSSRTPTGATNLPYQAWRDAGHPTEGFQESARRPDREAAGRGRERLRLANLAMNQPAMKPDMPDFSGQTWTAGHAQTRTPDTHLLVCPGSGVGVLSGSDVRLASTERQYPPGGADLPPFGLGPCNGPVASAWSPDATRQRRAFPELAPQLVRKRECHRADALLIGAYRVNHCKASSGTRAGRCAPHHVRTAGSLQHSRGRQ